MRAFEIHTFRDGQWKVDSVFDDRELAVHEARKVDENGRYSSVRVIEENYDEASDLTTTRTIFRGKSDAAKSKAPQPTSRKAARAAYQARNGRATSGRSRGQSRKKKSTSLVGPVLILFLLAICGIAVMFGLQHVSGLK